LHRLIDGGRFIQDDGNVIHEIYFDETEEEKNFNPFKIETTNKRTGSKCKIGYTLKNSYIKLDKLKNV